MKIGYKILLSSIILIGIVLIGTGVQAASFTSSILNRAALENLGGKDIAKATFIAGTFSEESSNQDGYDFATNASASKSFTSSTVVSSKNVFCIDKPAALGSTVTYTGSGSYSTFTNDIMAYILSAKENARGALVDGVVQNAVWYYMNEESVAKNNLYAEAEAFETYRNNYVQPTFNSSGSEVKKNSSGGYQVGPFSITYTSSYYGSTYFGNITGITIKDRDGNTVSSDKWSLSCSGTYPTSGETFYINTTTTKIKGPITMEISFNDVEAWGHYVVLTGTYTIYKREGTVFYCPDCTTIKNSGTAVTDEGWVYSEVTKTVKCGSSNYDTGAEGHPVQNHVKHCGNDVTVTVCSAELGSATNTVKCGNSYNYFYMSGTSEVYDVKYASCGGTNNVSVTIKDYKGKIGCGTKVQGEYEYIDAKRGLVTGKTNKECGKKYGEISQNTTVNSQQLIYGNGIRYTRTNKLSVEIELSIDIPVEKVWIDGSNNDGVRPSSVTAVLYGDGKQVRTLTLSASNGWKSVFEELPAYSDSGSEITYTIDEASTPTQYLKSTSGDKENGFVITNTQYINIEVVKDWVDASNRDRVRPRKCNGYTV